MVSLKAQTASFQQGMREGRKALNEMREDTARLQQQMGGLRGGAAGLLASFNSFRGAAAVVGMDFIGKEVAKVTSSFIEMQAALKRGEANFADLILTIGEGAPIIGGFVATGKQIGEAFLPAGESQAGVAALRKQAEQLDKLRDHLAGYRKEAKLLGMNPQDRERALINFDATEALDKLQALKGSIADFLDEGAVAAANRELARAAENIEAIRQAKLSAIDVGPPVGLEDVESLHRQLQVARGADPLVLDLEAKGAAPEFIRTATAMAAELRAIEERNAKLAETRMTMDSLTDSVKRATLGEDAFQIAQLAANGATEAQIALAEDAQEFLKLRAEAESLKGSVPDLGGGASSVSALREGTVQAASAERRNAQNLSRIQSIMEQQLQANQRVAQLTERQTELLARIEANAAGLEAV